MGISIFPIHMGLDTVYAVKGDGVIVIDGGDPHKLKNFKKGIAEVRDDLVSEWRIYSDEEEVRKSLLD